ncbi:MAG: serine/threonine-protein kinase [Candidatus Sumerlaeia bacterium]|nr:serine/threonine-protein kinase [Candidatus Sumerlaeia bacterium]
MNIEDAPDTLPPPALPPDATLTFDPSRPGDEETARLGYVMGPGDRPGGAAGDGSLAATAQVRTDPAAPLRAEASSEGYVLERRIGAGGFGEVWRASQVALRRTVAVKIIRGGAGEGQEARLLRRAFRDEALTAAQLDHPNIVPVYDFATERGGASMLAMKLVQGVPWNRAIESDFAGSTAEDFLARHIPILVAVAQAVAFAHSRGIIHRDLKPHQVMIGEFGEVLLMDWGLAVNFDPERLRETRGDLAMGSAPTAEEASSPAGTPAYMAPEQTRRTADAVGPWTDIYLLGAILFVLLSGSPPRSGTTGHGAFAAAAAGRFDDIGKVAPEGRAMPADLVELCLQCLEPDRSKRPAAATEVVGRLQGHLSGARARSESAAITAEAAKRIAEAADYEECNALGARLEQASALWPGNPEAMRLGHRLAEYYGRLALRRGDLALASLQARKCAPGVREALLGGVAAAEARIRSRERTRRLAIGSSLALLLALLGGSAYYTRVLEARAESEAAARRLAEEKQSEAERNFAAAKAQGEGSAALVGYILGELRAAMAEEFDSAEGLDPKTANRMRHAIAGRVVKPTVEYYRSVDATAWPDELALPFADSMQQASGYIRTLGLFDDALELGTTTLALRRARLAPDDPKLLANLSSLAITYKDKGEIRKALEMELDIAATYERSPQRDEAAYATAMHNLGMRYHMLGESDASLDWFTRALAIRERVFGPETERVATPLVGRAAALNKLGRMEAALADIQRAVAIREKTIGTEATDTLTARAMLATVLSKMGRDGEAIAILQEDLGRTAKAFGEGHGRVGVVHGKLADALASAGRHEEAVGHSDHAVAIYAKFYGERHRNTGEILIERARIRFRAGQGTELLADFADGLAIMAEAGEGMTPSAVEYAREYLSIRSLLGDHTGAIEEYRTLRAALAADPSAGVTPDKLNAALATALVRRARAPLLANPADAEGSALLEEALSLADANGSISTGSPRWFLWECWMHHLAGRDDAARAAYAKLIAARPPGQHRRALAREESLLEEVARRIGVDLPEGWATTATPP